MRIYLYIICFALCSCASQNLFEGKNPDSVDELLSSGINYEHIISNDDKVSVSIWGHDDLSFGSAYSIYNSNETFGKWLMVSDSGTINLPKLGRIRISGLTCESAAEFLETLYSKYLVKPVIAVRVLNKSVDVLGEVRTPGHYVFDEDSRTLAEAIALAQGMNEFSDIRRIQLIRGDHQYEIDLMKNEHLVHRLVINSGDIIHVPSKRSKVLHRSAPTIIPFTSVITALALVITVLSSNE